MAANMAACVTDLAICDKDGSHPAMGAAINGTGNG
jgi:hypothetical protein